MIKILKKEALLVLIVLTFLGLLGLSLSTYNTPLTITFVGLFGGAFSIILAFVNPRLFCFAIIFIAPLSINVPNLGGGLALSLPAEGMLGLLLLLSFIKLFAGVNIDKKILLHPITIVLLLDIAWMVISSFTSTMPEISFKRIILKISFILGFYLLFAHLFKTPKDQIKLFVLYAIGLIVPIFNAFYNHSKFDFSQNESFEMTEPFYEDHTLYGACLAFLVPFFLLFMVYKIRKHSLSINTYFFIFLFVLIVVAEILSYSRAAWISVMGALGIYLLTLFKIPPKYYFSILIIIVSVFVVRFDDIYQNFKSGDIKKNDDNVEQHLETVTDLRSNASNLERINRWVCAYRMFEEKPLTGWGPGTYQFNYGQFQTNEFTTEISSNTGDRGNAHSEYLSYLSEQGIIGLIIFLALIVLYFNESIKLLNSIHYSLQKIVLYGFFLGLITFFIHGLFNAFSDYEKMSILVYGSLAGIVSISNYVKFSTDS